MAIDAKISFMNQTEKRLSTEITAEDMTKVMTIVADVLEGFEMLETVVDIDTNDDLLNCYIDALKVQGRSAKTLERYRYIITKMMKKVGVSTRRVTVYHLRSYLSTLQAKGVKDTTIEGERQVFSAYFNWLQRESLIERNPTANLGAIKCAKKKKKIFSRVDIEKLRNNCKTERDKAIVSFLAATGCRISEVTGLNRDEIDFNGLECVVHGKGNKERTVYIDPVAALQLRTYIDGRKDACPALFAGKGGKRLLPGGVRCTLKELAERAGVEHCHPHKFRRTLATELGRHGMPIQEIATVLGHDKIDTTMKYVIVNEEETKHDYRRYA
jgi:site-specific recombinase XerD